jgi:hypothetical protein
MQPLLANGPLHPARPAQPTRSDRTLSPLYMLQQIKCICIYIRFDNLALFLWTWVWTFSGYLLLSSSCKFCPEEITSRPRETSCPRCLLPQSSIRQGPRGMTSSYKTPKSKSRLCPYQQQFTNIAAASSDPRTCSTKFCS